MIWEILFIQILKGAKIRRFTFGKSTSEGKAKGVDQRPLDSIKEIGYATHGSTKPSRQDRNRDTIMEERSVEGLLV